MTTLANPSNTFLSPGRNRAPISEASRVREPALSAVHLNMIESHKMLTGLRDRIDKMTAMLRERLHSEGQELRERIESAGLPGGLVQASGAVARLAAEVDTNFGEIESMLS